ncbi:hypothetical protein CWB41_14005 [Methylovirgula ligni]|uniref:Uncharacterized protein n=1 Tax=Methylovirgula ligni TaxID=569860 RepID=A0A3D9YQX4_9HYPH|nr:hypothetical protein [Methylovirgula ligni]QAY96707.1 hypothetical protein CWB41_14005 [Methylovirgula ligni]REF83252.1 hypothetical protein DES32_3168 [Methylovirgula ligni]
MAATGAREEIYEALLEKLQKLTGFKEVTRRKRPGNYWNVKNTPALVLAQAGQDYERKSVNLPPTRRLTVYAILYNVIDPNDQNSLPETPINNALDAIDAALKPQPYGLGQETLGGIVDAVYSEGKVQEAPGDFTGQAIAILPIILMLP